MKVAIVTGASRGIGRACALRLARDGYTVVINYAHREDEARAVLDAIEAAGGAGMLCQADVSDPAAVRAMMRDVSKAYGQIDLLVNNAGIVRDEYLLMLTPETLDQCLDLNVKGYLYCAQQAVLKMFRKKSGAIINMSSVSGTFALAGQTVYSATKGAVNAMTRTMAKELAPYGIRVNAVAPGFIETDMLDALPEEKKQAYLDAIPMHRLGKPAGRHAGIRRLRLHDRAGADHGRRTFAMMNIYEVNRHLRQRPPFQMIERVLELTPGVSAVGTKTVSANDPWFAGHFPGTPLLPGVLIVETCAQLCSLTVESGAEQDDRLYVLLKVDNFKFLHPVIPGDVMTVTVTKKSGAGPLISFDAQVTVDGQLRSKGSLSFTAMDRSLLESSGGEVSE